MMHKILKNIFRWKWIISAALCFLLLNILPASLIEKYYSTGFFIFIRKILDNTVGKLPFPAYYLFVIFLIIVIVYWFLHFFKEKPQPILERFRKIISFIGFLITWFFIFWGFNYGRIPLEHKLNIEVKPLTETELIDETNETIKNLESIRNKIQHDTNVIPQIVFINDIENSSRTTLNNTLQEFNYPYSNKVRGRFVIDDMFLMLSIGGQYLPFVGEANVDDAVFYSKKPFYLIHEMAHANGFTEEASCNFLSYVSCMQSNKLPMRYSGELNYLTYLMAELRYRNIDEYEKIKSKLPIVIRKDLEEIKLYYEKHTFKYSFIGDAMNNIYLKIMGINDGVKNYDKMVLLIYAWKHK